MHGTLKDSRWATGGTRSSSVPAARHSQWTSTTTRTISTTTQSSSATTNPLQNGDRPVYTVITVQPSTAIGELRKFMVLARRLRWKLSYLADGYRKATASPDSAEDIDPTEAELMFKLDFFEFYMYCERALVHLQAVFGISISRGAGQQYGGVNGVNGARTGYVSDHRYHANVLEALDRADNPLHEALGCGDVRQQLARAKDLRNRWKDAGDDPDRPDMPNPPPLASYDLERMVASIFAGFETAYPIAERSVEELRETHARAQTQASGDGQTGSNLLADMLMFEQGDFQFISEAMDWEAV